MKLEDLRAWINGFCVAPGKTIGYVLGIIVILIIVASLNGFFEEKGKQLVTAVPIALSSGGDTTNKAETHGSCSAAYAGVSVGGNITENCEKTAGTSISNQPK